MCQACSVAYTAWVNVIQAVSDGISCRFHLYFCRLRPCGKSTFSFPAPLMFTSWGQDQLLRLASLPAPGCIMPGNFAPMRGSLCVERERERGSSAAINRTRFKRRKKKKSSRSQQATSPAERNNAGFPEWGFGNRQPSCFVVCLRVEESPQVSFRCFVSGKEARSFVLLEDGTFWGCNNGPRFRWEFAPGAVPCTRVGTVAFSTPVCGRAAFSPSRRARHLGARDAREEQVQPGGWCGGLEGAAPQRGGVPARDMFPSQGEVGSDLEPLWCLIFSELH